MAYIKIVATAAFGLESIVANELRSLGYTELAVENGKVSFTGDYTDIVRCNLRLRCANRIFIELDSFSAQDFEDLFQGVKKIHWEELIPVNGEIIVTARSVKSRLFSLRDIQAISKKAIIEALKRKHKRNEFPENGPSFHIDISILKDQTSVLLDTSGEGLHKRGYRTTAGEAPIRETLAAALVYISRWDPRRILADPLCGSGTVAIEAALLGKNRAPGIMRNFAAEKWPFMPTKIWDAEREKALSEELDIDFKILASDSDYHVFTKARENAEAAGVGELITFQKKPVQEFNSKHKYGCIITNPPYGKRIGSDKKIISLYSDMGSLYKHLDTWSFFIITAFEGFESCFGAKADKNRKLYNGKIKTYLYQYLRPLPPKN